jgi:hypothetical protein
LTWGDVVEVEGMDGCEGARKRAVANQIGGVFVALDRTACRLPLSFSLRLIVVLNEKLLEVMGDDVTQEQAFAHANDVLKNAVGGISDAPHGHRFDRACADSRLSAAATAWPGRLTCPASLGDASTGCRKSLRRPGDAGPRCSGASASPHDGKHGRQAP